MEVTALYEDAFDKHLRSQAYVYRTQPSFRVAPTLALDGVDGPLAHPWTSTQEQQLTAMYTKKVPADKLSILNAVKWSKYLKQTALPALQRSLYVNCDVCIVLSHLCVDSAETTLAPTPEIPHVVGTLLVSLPSTYEGGELTFTNGTDTQTLLMEPNFRPGWAPKEHCILLDWYFDSVLPTRPNDNYLGKWLPASLLLVVDSFVYSRVAGWPLELFEAPTRRNRLQDLPEALLAAIECQPSLHQAPYIAAITAALANYLEVANGVDATLLSTCPALSHNAHDVILGIFMFAERMPLPVATAALVASFLLGLTPTVQWERCKSLSKKLPSVHTLAVFLSALAILSPEAALQGAVKWRSVLPQTLDTSHDERYRALLVYLATECRAALVGGGALPPLNDAAVADMDIDATHCDQCAAFASHLRARTETERLHAFVLCGVIDEIAARHPQELTLELDDDGYIVHFRRRKPPVNPAANVRHEAGPRTTSVGTYPLTGGSPWPTFSCG
ncbi:hypothetical protein SDRG_00597 [Saprolegnia diclina VS20]|uniref:Uncharacterized protein n=1 Tax=Saprolegnia diclina (strain VS20) TaxID=1156394 RepID=T0QXA7_SAPDV|nr:hypothetical protein SDRG_00597 [Saprolegnia diclina VS20]EQC42879.1 hypothetical protein SDRG_00597 [Saprolegnia diclina VS20]|eukprot:XP_008604302.1 hypothetical protein SDRG_00597 [Saprolegnia diclina VS20]